jgi:hypothetical protein
MASNPIHCEIIATNLLQPTAIQLDEEHNALYVLTNYHLTRIDLNNNKNDVQIVNQHNRRFQGKKMDDDIDEYSQGESDEDPEMRGLSDPFEDSEPSTDDDEDKITNRRNWRRYGWRTYRLDNPCSILFLSEKNQLIVLNEGVITFLTIELEDNRPFVQGSSKNIFCYDFDVFNQSKTRQSVQPWSIARTSKVDYFIFSLLQDSQLYSIDMTNQNAIIEKFTTTNVNYCSYLLFHPQSNKIFVYDSTQILAMSPDDRTTVKVDTPFIEEGKTISAMAIDKIGHVYILSDSTIYKCTYQSNLQLVECLGKIDISMHSPQMVVTNIENQFYFCDAQLDSVYRWRKING